MLDRDILSVDPDTIADTKVLATYLDGRLVHSAPPGDAETMTEEMRSLESGGTSARRACASGCTATEFVSA